MKRRRRLRPISEKRAASQEELAALLPELNERSGGICEVCLSAPAEHPHHRLRRSQGGAHTLDNLLHVCAEDHRLIHSYPELSYDNGWLIRPTYEIRPRRSWT
jgi:HNH endonuclease